MLSEGSRSLLSLFILPTRREDYAAAYLLREQGHGRALEEILGDPYIRNRLSPAQAGRLFDRPELVQALGQAIIAAERKTLAAATS